MHISLPRYVLATVLLLASIYILEKVHRCSMFQSLWLGSLNLCVSEILSVLVGRYFGSVEGSKFVEIASVDNVKRTWVNYGVAREWSDPTQGQVGRGEGVWLQLKCVNP